MYQVAVPAAQNVILLPDDTVYTQLCQTVPQQAAECLSSIFVTQLSQGPTGILQIGRPEQRAARHNSAEIVLCNEVILSGDERR